MKRLLLALSLALGLLLGAAAVPAFADDGGGDKVIFGDNFTLSAGETIHGDLVVFGGNVTAEEESTVTGTVVVVGGNVELAGTVEEDVVVFGGNADLRSSAVVEGELVTFGGSTSRAEGARVRGGESQGFGPSGNGFWPPIPDRLGVVRPILRFYGSVFNVVFGAVAMGLLALLIVLFWPDQTARVSAAVTNAPAAAGGLGLLSGIAVPVLLLLTAITLCLLPVSFLGGLVFATAILLGWVALGMLVGARLTAALRWHSLSPAVSAAIGTGLFTLVANIIGQIPCVGWAIVLVLGAIGLGAVALTRFGTQPYLPNVPAQPTPPPSPPAPDAGEATPA